jgi:hypothetical protein
MFISQVFPPGGMNQFDGRVNGKVSDGLLARMLLLPLADGGKVEIRNDVFAVD